MTRNRTHGDGGIEARDKGVLVYDSGPIAISGAPAEQAITRSVRAAAGEFCVLTRTEAIGMLGLSPRTWARLEAQGETPPKIRLSAGRIGYAAGDLHKWVEARREASLMVPQTRRGSRAAVK